MEKKKKKIPIDVSKKELKDIIMKNPYVPEKNPVKILDKALRPNYNPFAVKQQHALMELNRIGSSLSASLKIPSDTFRQMSTVLSAALKKCIIIGKKAGLNLG